MGQSQGPLTSQPNHISEDSMMQPGRYKILERDWLWPMPMNALNHTCCMEYRLMKISPTKTYNMAYIRLQTPGNKDPIMKVPHVNGVSSRGIIPLSVINLLDASYAWVAGIVKTNVATPTNAVRSPSHVESTQTIPDSITPVIHEVSSIVTPSS
jgi:hypothetical protein